MAPRKEVERYVPSGCTAHRPDAPVAPLPTVTDCDKIHSQGETFGLSSLSK